MELLFPALNQGLQQGLAPRAAPSAARGHRPPFPLDSLSCSGPQGHRDPPALPRLPAWARGQDLFPLPLRGCQPVSIAAGGGPTACRLAGTRTSLGHPSTCPVAQPSSPSPSLPRFPPRQGAWMPRTTLSCAGDMKGWSPSRWSRVNAIGTVSTAPDRPTQQSGRWAGRPWRGAGGAVKRGWNPPGGSQG